jgi:hypothetical protein
MRKLQTALATVAILVPMAAFAGDGGGLDGSGALLIQAVGRAIGKLFGFGM